VHLVGGADPDPAIASKSQYQKQLRRFSTLVGQDAAASESRVLSVKQGLTHKKGLKFFEEIEMVNSMEWGTRKISMLGRCRILLTFKQKRSDHRWRVDFRG
jgi:hypothetical protein